MKKRDKEIPSEIAKPASLKEARKRLGKTQAQIAREIGVKFPQAIQHVELGTRSIPANKAMLFAKAYGVPVEQLKTLWVRKPTVKQQPTINDYIDVLPIIKSVAEIQESALPRLTLGELKGLIESTSQFQKCTPGLIKEILTCGFK